MNRLGLVLILLLLPFGLWGCGNQEQPSSAGVQESTVQMGDETLFKSGDNWIFQYSSGSSSCFIVGDKVSFGSREADHLVVKLDDQVSVNVPTNGKHRVLRVDLHGFTEVAIDPERFASPKELLQAVLTVRNEPA